MLSIDFFYFNIPSFAICHLFFQGVEKRRGKILRKETNYVHFLYIIPLSHSALIKKPGKDYLHPLLKF